MVTVEAMMGEHIARGFACPPPRTAAAPSTARFSPPEPCTSQALVRAPIPGITSFPVIYERAERFSEDRA